MLLALLLMSVAFVPVVGAIDLNTGKQVDQISESITDDIITSNYIPVDVAREHATVMMLEYVSNGLDDGKWYGATISKEPLLIYDIDGNILFYQFSVEKNGEDIGEISTAASKVLGVSVQQIGDPVIFDPIKLKIYAENYVAENFNDYETISTKFVCYSYPKIGIMVELINPHTKVQQKIIFDANDFSIVPERMPKYEGESGAWSYYGQIPKNEYDKRILDWDSINEQINDIIKKANSAGINIFDPVSDENIQSLNQIIPYGTKAQEIGQITPIPTTLQEESSWCMVATAWIITKYYYPSTTRTQTSIGSYMGVSGDNAPTWDNQFDYYDDSYAIGGLGKTNSVSSYWPGEPALSYSMIKNEISYNRPLKVGYIRHSRACFGYWKNTAGYYYYEFSDPDTGTSYWEASPNPQSTSTGYTNYILVK